MEGKSMPTKQNFDTDAILKEIYPLIEESLKTRLPQWKRCMSEFIQARSKDLFDIAPFERIYYNENDSEALFNALGLIKKSITLGLRHTYYFDKTSFKPSQAKDETTVVCLCVVRYFLLHNMEKELDLAMIYQSFSGKYYPSIHYGFFKTVAPSKYRHIMEYVVNNKLSQKFDLKAAGSLIGAVKKINTTWVTSYKSSIKSFDDEDCTYVIQQLHNRLKSFMKNIASVYYETYKSKEYMTYDKDALPDGDSGGAYHLTTNDTFKLQHYVENTMEKINTSQVDYSICKSSSDANVKTEELKAIMETIFDKQENIVKIKELLTCLIAAFLQESKVKEINTPRFYHYCIKPKPNTKDANLIRIKDLIEELLDDNSVAYRKRKHRGPTKNSYHKALLSYLALIAIRANR